MNISDSNNELPLESITTREQLLAKLKEDFILGLLLIKQ